MARCVLYRSDSKSDIGACERGVSSQIRRPYSPAREERDMDAYHARYPFLDEARESVEAADVDLGTLVATDHTAVERGRERVKRALTEGAVGTDRHVSPRTELLSYPIARVLVSLLDTPGAIEKYAAAEAETAHARFVEEFDGESERQRERSPRDHALSLEALLQELDLTADVQETNDSYRIAVGPYLQFVPAGDDWSLVSRELADGYVSVSRSEVLELLREAIETRVVAGLPFEVPTEISEPLRPTVRDIQSVLASVEYPRTIDRVEPELFPDCISALIERSRADDDLEPPERFTLISFLAAIGMDADDIRDFCAKHDERFTHATERLSGEDSPYPPPSFETMKSYGICENEQNHDHTHPLEAYAARLSTGDDVANE